MEKIGIVGFGYVGKALERFFKRRYDVMVYDKYINMHDGYPLATRGDINKCDLVVLSVPTPMADSGECDLSAIYENLGWLGPEFVLIKSTIPPGTTDELKRITGKRIVFSPEYIGESSYYTPPEYMHPTDMEKHPFQIFGGDMADTSEMVDYFLPIMGPAPKFMQMRAREAEMVKYMENAWGATKVTFCNEMYSICEAMGIDYNTVREGWLADNRINRMHTAVFKDKRGFGGKCLPKDTNALFQFAQKSGYSAEFINQVLRSNDRFSDCRSGE